MTYSHLKIIQEMFLKSIAGVHLELINTVLMRNVLCSTQLLAILPADEGFTSQGSFHGKRARGHETLPTSPWES